MLVRRVALGIFLALAAGTALAGGEHWGYAGQDGPEHWSELSEKYATCASGKQQSPIDIDQAVMGDAAHLAFDYQDAPLHIVNNGHTVEVEIPAGNSLRVNDRRYELVQFHFHTPSEETFHGKHYPMVAHLVHKDAEGHLAVVAVEFERGHLNEALQPIWSHLPAKVGESQDYRNIKVHLNQLLPAQKMHYAYEGSLTTPPCTEGVSWFVMEKPVSISSQQLASFQRLYPNNARPVQALNGRVIHEGR